MANYEKEYKNFRVKLIHNDLKSYYNTRKPIKMIQNYQKRSKTIKLCKKRDYQNLSKSWETEFFDGFHRFLF